MSASKLKEWQSCPLRFALKYIDRVPEDEEKDMIYIGIGHVVHHCYARATLTRELPTKFLQEAYDAYAHELKTLDTASRKRINNMLQAWYVIEPLTTGEETFAELSFWLDATHDGNVIFNGVIDLCVRRGQYFMVIDYKTMKVHRQAKDYEIRRDDQLCLYAIATAVLFDVPIAHVKTGMFFPENARLVTTNWSSQQAQTWLNSVLEICYQIINTERENVKPLPCDNACRWCEYRSRCAIGRELLRRAN